MSANSAADEPVGPHGESALQMAVHDSDMGAVRRAIEAGADVRLRYKSDATPAMIAAHGNQTEILALLLGADPRALEDSDGQVGTPLCHAVFGKAHDAARLLINRGCTVNVAPTSSGMTHASPLWRAIGGDDLEMASLLFDAGAELSLGDPAMNLLTMAVTYGDCALVALVLAHGGLDFLNKGAGTMKSMPLHSAAVRENGEDILGLLLRAGAFVHPFDDNHMTPLECAVKTGHRDIARILIEEGGADPNSRSDCRGDYALHFAIRNKDLAMVETLVAAGADPCLLKSGYLSPLVLAARLDALDIVRFLLPRLAAHPQPRWARGDCTNALYEAVKENAVGVLDYFIAQIPLYPDLIDVNGAQTGDESGDPPLLAAVRKNSAPLIEKLMLAGASADLLNEYGVSSRRTAHALRADIAIKAIAQAEHTRKQGDGTKIKAVQKP